jgi:hypothetical protein
MVMVISCDGGRIMKNYIESHTVQIYNPFDDDFVSVTGSFRVYYDCGKASDIETVDLINDHGIDLSDHLLDETLKEIESKLLEEL